jgi:hypothetical protein
MTQSSRILAQPGRIEARHALRDLIFRCLVAGVVVAVLDRALRLVSCPVRRTTDCVVRSN